MRIIALLLALATVAASLPPVPGTPPGDEEIREGDTPVATPSANGTGTGSDNGSMQNATENVDNTGSPAQPPGTEQPVALSEQQIRNEVKNVVGKEVDRATQSIERSVQRSLRSSVGDVRDDMKSVKERVNGSVRRLEESVQDRSDAFATQVNYLLYLLAALGFLTLVNTGMMVSLYFEEQEVEGEVEQVEEAVDDDDGGGSATSEVMDYVRRCKRRGMSDQEIAQALKRQGWSDDDVQKLFS